MPTRKPFRLNLRPLKKLVREFTQGPLPDPLGQLWAKRYSAFVRRRYKKEGNGTWQELKPATKAARRKGKGKGKGKIKILRDTGTLLAALQIGNDANLLKDVPHGIRFGFGGRKQHPGPKKKRKKGKGKGKGKQSEPEPGASAGKRATIADIASYHDEGIPGRLPKREILVRPDRKTVRGMLLDLRKTVGRVGKRAEAQLAIGRLFAR
jgi:hypothetical protein